MNDEITNKQFLISWIFTPTIKSLFGILAITGLYFYTNPFVESYDKNLSYIATFIFSIIVSTLSLVFVGSLVNKSEPKSTFYAELKSIKSRYLVLSLEIKNEAVLEELHHQESTELLHLNDKYR